MVQQRARVRIRILQRGSQNDTLLLGKGAMFPALTTPRAWTVRHETVVLTRHTHAVSTLFKHMVLGADDTVQSENRSQHGTTRLAQFAAERGMTRGVLEPFLNECHISDESVTAALLAVSGSDTLYIRDKQLVEYLVGRGIRHEEHATQLLLLTLVSAAPFAAQLIDAVLNMSWHLPKGANVIGRTDFKRFLAIEPSLKVEPPRE